MDDYFTHAREVAKLDFVVVSDHDFGNAAPWKMPQETSTPTQDKADQYTENGKFVAIAGYESTSQSKYWTPVEPLFEGPVKFYNYTNGTSLAEWTTCSVPETLLTTAPTCWPRRFRGWAGSSKTTTLVPQRMGRTNSTTIPSTPR